MIPRIPIKETGVFLERYYDNEQPVILTGTAHTSASAQEVCRELNERIAQDQTVTQRLFWYDVNRELLDEICGMPPLVDQLLNEQEAYVRTNCARIWFNMQGHTTPWHYDGHSLHVFNLQLKGRKRWTIVSPETPLCNMPFSKTCIFEKNTLRGKKYLEFEMTEGEMLFLPRYWYHHVHSMDELNVNVNWVLMHKRAPVSSAIARREREVLWVLERIYPFLLPATKALLDEYAGSGREAVGTLTRQVSTSEGLARVFREILRAPLVLLAVPSQLTKLVSLRRTKKQLRQYIQEQQEQVAVPELVIQELRKVG